MWKKCARKYNICVKKCLSRGKKSFFHKAVSMKQLQLGASIMYFVLNKLFLMVQIQCAPSGLIPIYWTHCYQSVVLNHTDWTTHLISTLLLLCSSWWTFRFVIVWTGEQGSLREYWRDESSDMKWWNEVFERKWETDHVYQIKCRTQWDILSQISNIVAELLPRLFCCFTKKIKSR